MASLAPCHAPNLLHHLLLQQLVNLLNHLEAYLSFIMTDSESKQTKWSNTETTTFVQYFHEHRAERGDGGFKKTTLLAAAEHIHKAHPNETLKSLNSVKYKFAQVCAADNAIYSDHYIYYYAAERHIRYNQELG